MAGGDALAEYRRKRDFARTPEPGGAPVVAGEEAGGRFVIQQHDATRLHWDLRLEHEGVLWSWALTRGVPWNPKENRLAVRTEDHPLEYLTFEGDIPSGEYGAGHMVVWDRGRYDADKLEEDKVIVTLHGERAQGTFALFRTRGRDWMIHRMTPPQDPDRRPLPGDVRPMEAVDAAELPLGREWHYELAWPGIRALVSNDAGRVGISSASGTDIGGHFPEIRRIGRALAAVEAIIDGVVVTTAEGRPQLDDAALSRRMAAKRPDAARRAAAKDPATLLAFDVVWLEGHPTGELPYEDRRTLLEELDLSGPAWQMPPSYADGEAVAAGARQLGLPGVVAKRADSPYRSGQRSEDWRRVEAAHLPR